MSEGPPAKSRSRVLIIEDHTLFAESLETLFDHVGEAPVVLDHLVDEAIAERLEQITDHYDARVEAMEGKGITSTVPYKPLPPAKSLVVDAINHKRQVE